MRILNISLLLHTICIGVLFCFVFVSQAANQQPTIKEAEGVVLQKMQTLIGSINSTVLPEEDYLEARQIIIDMLQHSITIESATATKRIMGPYWGGATEEERARIERIYVAIVYSQLANLMLDGDFVKLKDTFAYKIQNMDNKINVIDTPVRVFMQPYSLVKQLVFYMQFDGGVREWKTTNLLVDGVNQVAELRNKFFTLMKIHKKNYNRVISYWEEQF